jgi:flagellar hook-length control protein FliK
MVSGRLSLPQSFSSSPFPALGTTKGAAAPASGQARETPDFRSQFAPATQDLRSRRGGSTAPAEVGNRSGPGTEEAAGMKNAAEHAKSISDSGDAAAQERFDSARESAVDGEAEPDEETPAKAEDASGAQVKADEQSAAEHDQPLHTKGRGDVSRDGARGEQAATSVVSGDATSAGLSGAERTVASAANGDEVAGERYQRESGGVVRSDTPRDGAERRVTETSAQPVDADETAALKASTQAKQGDVPAAASGAGPVREHAEGQRPASVPAGGSDGEADGTEKVDAGARRHDGGDAGAGEDGEPESARRDVAQQQQHAAGRDEGVSASPQGQREAEPAASSRDERAAGRDADARVESQRAESESGTPRRDGAPLEAPSPVKLSGPSVADRLAPGAAGDAGRASSLQARVDADGQTSQAVVRGLNAVLRQGGGSLTMKLSPASLGEVRIEMSMQAGRVSVQFDVGNIAAYEAIKGHITELRQSLEQRGMTVERVETHVSPALAKSAQPDGQSNQRGGEQAGQNGQQDRHDAADGQSRGRADGGDRGGDGSAWDSDGSDGAETDFEQSLRLGLDAVA